MTETSNKTSDLNPLFLPIALDILLESQAKITKVSPGSIIRASTTLRSMADQAMKRAAGLSSVRLGWHQVGLAMDVAVITPAGAYVRKGDDPRYSIFGEVAKSHGCIWGGDWKVHPDGTGGPDYDHCEWHPGFTLQHYLAWLNLTRVVSA